jgi:hypothetical protein
MSSPEERPSFEEPSSPIGRVQSGLAALFLFESGDNVQANLLNNNINIEDGRRRNTRYLCRNMRSMAIIACKLQKFSALEHLLKLKSMLNVSSNKI